MIRGKRAVNLRHSGLNCAQAVMCAFSDVVGTQGDDLKKMGAAFGSGMGCMEATCGALCGAEIILGMKKYDEKNLMKASADLLKNFEKKCGATICKVLKGKTTGVVLCECDDCVENACKALEMVL